MVSGSRVRELLGPFELNLSADCIDRLMLYLDLLLRWNRKINLTSIRTPEECITRHFGESLLLSKIAPLSGAVLDIGSGAGFPGLALKVLAPELKVVLLEPVAKKRAFLKEVARSCALSDVQVLADRIEEFCRQPGAGLFDLVTARAVGSLDRVIPEAIRLMKVEGRLCLWLSGEQVRVMREQIKILEWLDPLPIPFSDDRRILIGHGRRKISE